jgi:hypothetical protein
MLESIGDYILKQRTGQRAKRSFTNWEQVKSICVITEKNSSFDQKRLTDAFKKHQKAIDIILFHPDKTGHSNDCFLSINKKDIGLLSVPKPETISKLRKKDFDVLIDCNMSGNPVSKAISVTVQAGCKVGHSGLFYSDIFDLCIDFKETPELSEYLSQAMNYLMMIKTNK